MLNFGLEELRLVNPRDGWPNPSALPLAAGATKVLDQARVFSDVGEAVSDCSHVFATTVRQRGQHKPVLTPAQAVSEIVKSDGISAILFGPERSGLDADMVSLARSIVTIPVNPEFGSLNLAQAVAILAYEYFKAERTPRPDDREEPAPQQELDQLIDHLFGALDGTGYFHPPERTPSTRRTLRSILTRPGWTAAEIRALRGVVSALDKPS